VIVQTEKCLEVEDDEPSTLSLTVDDGGFMTQTRLDSRLLLDDGL
jgi:hypothetical protein